MFSVKRSLAQLVSMASGYGHGYRCSCVRLLRRYATKREHKPNRIPIEIISLSIVLVKLVLRRTALVNIQ